MNTIFKAAIVAVAAFTATPAAAGSSALFNTIEYRTDNHDVLPKWQHTMKKIAAEKQAYAACAKNAKACESSSVHAWQTMIGQQKGARQIDQLQTVNSFINKWRYRADQNNYGRSDYWASPAEFFRRSGDCEDYAIAKYETLRQLGFSADQLRLVVVKDLNSGTAHAVLAAYVDGDVFILDNLSSKVRSQAAVTEYAPYYSVNELARWAHAEATPANLAAASGKSLFSRS